MSVNPNQTNANAKTSFYTLAGSGGGGSSSAPVKFNYYANYLVSSNTAAVPTTPQTALFAPSILTMDLSGNETVLLQGEVGLSNTDTSGGAVIELFFLADNGQVSGFVGNCKFTCPPASYGIINQTFTTIFTPGGFGGTYTFTPIGQNFGASNVYIDTTMNHFVTAYPPLSP